MLLRIIRIGASRLSTKTPPASVLIKKAAGIIKGSEAKQNKVGQITRKKIAEIAKTKSGPQSVDLEGAMKTIEGTARSNGHRTIIE